MHINIRAYGLHKGTNFHDIRVLMCPNEPNTSSISFCVHRVPFDSLSNSFCTKYYHSPVKPCTCQLIFSEQPSIILEILSWTWLISPNLNQTTHFCKIPNSWVNSYLSYLLNWYHYSDTKPFMYAVLRTKTASDIVTQYYKLSMASFHKVTNNICTW